MKFFHLSDLHIGFKFNNWNMDEDLKHIFDQIVEHVEEEKPDAFVVAGDIYDKDAPSKESMKMFNDLVNDLRAAVPDMLIMMISGNHDNPQTIDLFRDVLKKNKIYMIGQPPKEEDEYIEKVVWDQDGYGPVNFYLLPFVRPSMAEGILGRDENGKRFSYDITLHKLLERESINPEERNVLVSHQYYLSKEINEEDVERMDSETVTVGNIDKVYSDALEPFDYAALGHLHKPSTVGNENYKYCGTPIACSVSEADQQKGIVVVEMGPKGKVDSGRVIPLEPLHKVTKISGTLEEILARADELKDDYVIVYLDNKVDEDVTDSEEIDTEETDSEEMDTEETDSEEMDSEEMDSEEMDSEEMDSEEFSPEDLIESAFPNLVLPIRYLNQNNEENGNAAYDDSVLDNLGTGNKIDPLVVCKSFLVNLSPEEEEMLMDVINVAKAASLVDSGEDDITSDSDDDNDDNDDQEEETE